MSIIVAVPKVQNTLLAKELRRIDMVSVYEKREQAVKEAFLSYCNVNFVIEPNHSGFRRKHSCESVIIYSNSSKCSNSGRINQ